MLFDLWKYKKKQRDVRTGEEQTKIKLVGRSDRHFTSGNFDILDVKFLY